MRIRQLRILILKNLSNCFLNMPEYVCLGNFYDNLCSLFTVTLYFLLFCMHYLNYQKLYQPLQASIQKFVSKIKQKYVNFKSFFQKMKIAKSHSFVVFLLKIIIIKNNKLYIHIITYNTIQYHIKVFPQKSVALW